MLAPFGMIVQVDPEADIAFQTAQMANALVGAAEAHASRAEDAYRQQGAEPADLAQAGLMAFAAVPCQGPADDLALIQWRAQHLAAALNGLDFPGPIKRNGDIDSGRHAYPHDAAGRRRAVGDGHRRPHLHRPHPAGPARPKTPERCCHGRWTHSRKQPRTSTSTGLSAT